MTQDRASELLEQQTNLEDVEKRLAEVLDAPSTGRHAITILSAVVTVGSGAVLVATLSQSPPGSKSTMGIVSGLVMIAAGIVLITETLGRMDRDRREKRLLRAVRHLLRRDGD